VHSINDIDVRALIHCADQRSPSPSEQLYVKSPTPPNILELLPQESNSERRSQNTPVKSAEFRATILANDSADSN
jgi:hypothetical protein